LKCFAIVVARSASDEAMTNLDRIALLEMRKRPPDRPFDGPFNDPTFCFIEKFHFSGRAHLRSPVSIARNRVAAARDCSAADGETIPIWVENAAGAVRQSPHAREEKCMRGKPPSTAASPIVTENVTKYLLRRQKKFFRRSADRSADFGGGGVSLAMIRKQTPLLRAKQMPSPPRAVARCARGREGNAGPGALLSNLDCFVALLGSSQ
jgi:hypothetical protein